MGEQYPTPAILDLLRRSTDLVAHSGAINRRLEREARVVGDVLRRCDSTFGRATRLLEQFFVPPTRT